MIIMTDKLFGKYSVENIEVKDQSIAQAISLRPIIVPHTFGRYARKALGKTQVNIVERLTNKLMRGGTGEKTSGKVIRTHGRMQGKKLRALKAVEGALDIVQEETKENPVQVLIRALENSAPREDVTRVSHGGVSYQIAVDISATRRLDMALRNIALAALMGAFGKPKPLSRSLADEIISTSKGDIQSSYAMKKRDETERMARSAR
jgi:small subunit ribosomal protein S7